MIKVGITGQSGFLGTHLYNTLGLYGKEIERVNFEDSFFSDEGSLCRFVRECDVIVHFAAINRHPDARFLYETNIRLVQSLVAAMEHEQVTPYLLFASSIQEELENEYGCSKREGRRLLEEWAERNQAFFTGLVLPNVFGPFGMPGYNSFIATFCYRLTHGESPEVLQDNSVKLLYVGSLCAYIIQKIKENVNRRGAFVEKDAVACDFEKKVTEILALLETYKRLYFDQGIIPVLKDRNEVNLFNTFCCYIDTRSYFPVKLTRHTDSRGTFVEVMKSGIGGQASFSTTLPGITRGNHYHTRKIERFTVIKGKAQIQLRKIGTDEVLNFDLDGDEPSYVDMPVWYTHNIINIGNEELYTQFWINEWYNPEDGDTYFEQV